MRGLFLMQSPDGDHIDCVVSHLQPAFDHPLLKGQKPLVVELYYDKKSNLIYLGVLRIHILDPT